MSNSRYIPGFDLLKFMMAAVIVSLHAEVTTVMSPSIAGCFANFQALAVPIFFVLSSYLFFEKLKKSSTPLKNLWIFEKRLFILYLIWSLIMLPITLRNHDYISYGIMGLFLWIKDFLFDYTFLASWFFGALLVATPLVYIIRKYLVFLIVVSMTLYGCFEFYDLLPPVMKCPFEMYHRYLGYPQRSFLCGIIWISVGCILSREGILPLARNLLLTNRSMLSGGGILLMIIILASCQWGRLQLMGVLAFTICFYLVLYDATSSNINSFCKTLRKSSVIIFCVHYPLLHVMWRIVPDEKVLAFGWALVLSIILSFFIVQLSKTKHLKFLQYLY